MTAFTKGLDVVRGCKLIDLLVSLTVKVVHSLDVAFSHGPCILSCALQRFNLIWILFDCYPTSIHDEIAFTEPHMPKALSRLKEVGGNQFT